MLTTPPTLDPGMQGAQCEPMQLDIKKPSIEEIEARLSFAKT